MVIHFTCDYNFDDLLRYWRNLDTLRSIRSAGFSRSSSVTASPTPHPHNCSYRSFALTMQTDPSTQKLTHHFSKRENSTEVDAISVNSDGPAGPRSSKTSRQRLFEALEHGNSIGRTPRNIRSADDLEELELKRCFEILHCCGTATDATATLKTTRETIEDYLDAVFKDWSANNDDDIEKPVLDFTVREAVAVGKICEQLCRHHSIEDCTTSATCHSQVFVVAIYRSKQAKLEMGFCLEDMLNRPMSEEPEFISALQRQDIRWMNLNFMGLLRKWLSDACVAKVHKYNKHMALWHTRKLVRGWSKGSLSMGGDEVLFDYVRTETVNAAFTTMGLIMTNQG